MLSLASVVALDLFFGLPVQLQVFFSLYHTVFALFWAVLARGTDFVVC